ncbi:MAG: di-heme oxidoredictase family protein [Planctomycetota bacterium]
MQFRTSTLVLFTALTVPAAAQAPVGEAPALGDPLERIQQSDLTGGTMTLDEVRAAGLKIFATPFNTFDGYGDGPMLDPNDTVSPGNRPTLQNNGTFLRVNGLDAQTCMECHSVGSFATVPFRFAVGGVGASNNNVLFQPRNIDVDDEAANQFADFDGRYINPPFLFGSGGVELVGKEMTIDLQGLKIQAFRNPGVVVQLNTHGVHFGTLSYDDTTRTFDTSGIEGVDHDLVVRPFGRKGEFATVRGFDVDAMLFHFGMEPVEAVGADVDNDGDGIVNEITIGELSALHIFNTNLERPEMRGSTPESVSGAKHFLALGCADCHVPNIDTRAAVLRYTFPEVEEKPRKNAFFSANLAASKAGFDSIPGGGVSVPMFSDLKRHDMGPGLAESFGSELDSEFITARLWGVADTAPYLHDGRALSLTQAILLHGGEAQAARDNFDAAPDVVKAELLAFLRTLRTPVTPAADLLD